MGSGGAFSAGNPEEPARPIAPLDAGTAERLLSGRLDPDDAPPGYAEVARLVRTAAAPADPSELAGEAAAMDAFRMSNHPTQPVHRVGGAPGHRARSTARRGRVRGRLAALALAGAVAVGGVGVWTAGGAAFLRELRSPSGGPSAGGSGSGVPGSGAYGSGTYGSGVDGAGSLRPASPGLGSGPGVVSVTDGRPPSLPSAGERATARRGVGVTSGGGSPHGAKPNRPAKQPKPKPEKPTPQKPEPPKPEPPKPEPPKPEPPKPKSPEAKVPKASQSKAPKASKPG